MTYLGDLEDDDCVCGRCGLKAFTCECRFKNFTKFGVWCITHDVGGLFTLGPMKLPPEMEKRVREEDEAGEEWKRRGD